MDWGLCGAFGGVRSRWAATASGCGLCGVDDGEWVVEGGEGAADCGLEEWVVGAAEQEGLGVGGFGEGFGEVDAEDFVGDGVVGPAFFDEGDEEGAGFFVGFEVEGFEGSGVGVGLDCRGGGEDEDLGGDLGWSIPSPRVGSWVSQWLRDDGAVLW